MLNVLVQEQISDNKRKFKRTNKWQSRALVLMVSTQNDGISNITSGFIIIVKNPKNALSTYLESSLPKILEIICKIGLISVAKIYKERKFSSGENCPYLGVKKDKA